MWHSFFRNVAGTCLTIIPLRCYYFECNLLFLPSSTSTNSRMVFALVEIFHCLVPRLSSSHQYLPGRELGKTNTKDHVIIMAISALLSVSVYRTGYASCPGVFYHFTPPFPSSRHHSHHPPGPIPLYPLCTATIVSIYFKFYDGVSCESFSAEWEAGRLEKVL